MHAIDGTARSHRYPGGSIWSARRLRHVLRTVAPPVCFTLFHVELRIPPVHNWAAHTRVAAMSTRQPPGAAENPPRCASPGGRWMWCRPESSDPVARVCGTCRAPDARRRRDVAAPRRRGGAEPSLGSAALSDTPLIRGRRSVVIDGPAGRSCHAALSRLGLVVPHSWSPREVGALP